MVTKPRLIPDGSHPRPKPDYEGLVRFLLEPFLESPQNFKVDCEVSQDQCRIWIRVAFEGEEIGRVFGRGRRNIQAVRTVIVAFSQAAGDSVYLDIFGA